MSDEVIPKKYLAKTHSYHVYERIPDCTYLIGMDPIWYISTNLLTYVNSFKMKLSVIIGVAQMAMGVCMKGLNSIYFKNKLDFFCEFVP